MSVHVLDNIPPGVLALRLKRLDEGPPRHRLEVMMVRSVTVDELAAAHQRGERIVDVRERFEFDGGHIPGVDHVAMALVPLRIDEFTGNRPVWVVCESGNRSWQVADYLSRHGVEAYNVNGGMTAWRAAGLPQESGVGASS